MTSRQSELEALVKEQAREMRYGNGLARQGENWMRAVVSLDRVSQSGRTDLGDMLASDGTVYFGDQRSGGKTRNDKMRTGCAIHGVGAMKITPAGHVYCSPCNSESTRRYNQTEKGKERIRRQNEKRKAERRARGLKRPAKMSEEERKRRSRERAKEWRRRMREHLPPADRG